MNVITEFPGLVRAVKELAYDNGCINRFHDESEVVTYALTTVFNLDLCVEMAIADAYCCGLDDEALNELCCGEPDGTDHEPASKLGVTDRILNELFDNLVPQ